MGNYDNILSLTVVGSTHAVFARNTFMYVTITATDIFDQTIYIFISKKNK